MSANGETSAVMKGIKHGACDYLLKPVRMEELRNIWQHVVRKKWRNTGPSCMNEDDRVKQVSDDGDYNSSANEGPDVSWKQSKKRKDVKEEDEDLGTLEESSISFRLSGPNERLSRNDQPDDELASSGDGPAIPAPEVEETGYGQREEKEETNWQISFLILMYDGFVYHYTNQPKNSQVICIICKYVVDCSIKSSHNVE